VLNLEQLDEAAHNLLDREAGAQCLLVAHHQQVAQFDQTLQLGRQIVVFLHGGKQTVPAPTCARRGATYASEEDIWHPVNKGTIVTCVRLVPTEQSLHTRSQSPENVNGNTAAVRFEQL